LRGVRRDQEEENDMAKGPIYNKSFAFAVRVIKLARFLQSEKREYVLSKQVIRCGTAIGAMVRESEHAESKSDFVHKMNVALKEANETLYWLELLQAADLIDQASFESIACDNVEILKLLAAIVKTSKESKSGN
jgi:four helix bundle protein